MIAFFSTNRYSSYLKKKGGEKVFELNKEQTLEQLAKAMGISYNTIRHNKKKYLDYLSYYCEYTEQKKGRAYIYVITKQYEPFIPMTRGQKNIEIMRHRLRYDILLRPDGSRQTASNVGEILADEMGVKPATAAKQASSVLKQYYGEQEGDEGEDGKVVRKVWAYHVGQVWQELGEEILQELRDRYKKEKQIEGLDDDAEMCAFEDYEEGGITLSLDELTNRRMKLYNRLKYQMCAEHNWRWIMRVKEYKVHPGTPPS